MNSHKTNGAMRTIQFTEIEFGSMTIVLEDIRGAKIKRAFDASMRNMKSFLRSMAKIRCISALPDDFYIISITKVLAVQSFPADIYYDVVIAEVIKNAE